MILIESVKYREVPGPITVVTHFEPDGPLFDLSSSPPPERVVTQETIVGERFVDCHGRKVTIGMTKEVSDVLGLPMEAYKNQHEWILEQRATIKRLRYELNSFERMSFWQRLVHLFNSWTVKT